MTYDEYWNQDPWLAADYRKSWELRQKEKNYEAWLHGLYVYKAVGVVMQNMFRKKGTQAATYFDKPIEEERKKTVQEIRQETYDMLKKYEDSWNGK